MSKKIGILGGLGPEATLDLYKKIISATPAKTDQEHIETIIISNPKIPDRTQAIIYGGECPIPSMVSTAKTLEATGVSTILIPCNTAHYFLNDIQKEINVPITNMIRETVTSIKEEYPHIKTVGILATTGTIKAKIYQNELEKEGFNVVISEEDVQENFIMEAIYGTRGIKAGFKKKPRTLLKYAALHLAGKGADIIIKGCTEIAIVLNKKNCEQILIDPAGIVAKKAVEICTSEKYNETTQSKVEIKVNNY
jgi:aspartate racemase